MGDPAQLSRRLAIPWVLKGPGRVLMSCFAAGIGVLVTLALPDEMRLIISFDFAAVVYVGLFLRLMTVAKPEDVAELSQGPRSRSLLMLISIVVFSAICAMAISVLALSQKGTSYSLHVLHLTSSLLAICLSWLVTNIAFGLYYVRIFYTDSTPDDVVEYDEGMAYPNKKMPDYWDFMYYSFTIAMCYQTSDVTITTTAVRRVTLLHAIFSFFFVATIIGLVVNVVSNFV